MIADIVLGIAMLVVLVALGWSVIAPLKQEHQALLFPATPVLGAALLATVLSTTSRVMPTTWGLVITLGVALALVVVGVRRGNRPGRTGAPALAWLSVTLLVGLAGTAVALVPSLWVGDGAAIMSTGNHDVFYFVAESAWLDEQSVTPGPEMGDVPGAGNASPADTPMRASLDLPLRFGQPLVHSALSVATGQAPVENVMIVAALWVLISAPTAFVGARLIGLRHGFAVALSALTSTASLLVYQVYAQNLDSLLGASLAIFSICVGLAALERRTALWPASLAVAALAAVYTEYALFVAPPLLAAALVRRPREIPRSLLRALQLVGLAVLIAPVAWWSGLGTLLIRRDGDGMGSPFFSDGPYAAISRIVGTSPVGGPLFPSRITMVLATLAVLGIVLALLLSRHRVPWFVLITVGIGYIAHLTAGHHGYTQMRTVFLYAPLLTLVVVAGWDALVSRLHRIARLRIRPSWTVVQRTLTAALAVTVVVAAGANLRTALRSIDRTVSESRHFDETYTEAAGWVDAVGGARGSDVSVFVPDFVPQLWTAHSLRSEKAVSYPTLRPDYLGVIRYWAGEVDRWALIGPGATFDAPPQAVVRQNERFSLVDIDAGGTVVVVPQDTVAWLPGAVGVESMVGPDLGKLLVVRSPGSSGPVALTIAVDDPSVSTVRVDAVGAATSVSAPVTDGLVTLVIDLGTESVETLQVDVGADGRAEGSGFRTVDVVASPA